MWLAALVSRSMILMRIPSGVCSTTESSWPFSATAFRLFPRSPRPSVSVSTSRCSMTKFAGAVHVGVGHDDDPVVAELLEIELVADVRPDRRDDRLDLRVREHLVDSVLLGVDHLAAQRQDRLERAVARIDGGAAGRVALDEVELRGRRVIDRAVRELARQRHAVERALAAGQLARLARGLARVASRERLVDDLLRLGRVLLEELRELDVDRLLDETAHPGIAELRLRLALELRHSELDGDDSGEALADILALQVLVLLLEQTVLPRVVVQRPRQRRLEAGEVRAAL